MKLDDRDIKFLLSNLKDATLLKRLESFSADEFNTEKNTILFSVKEFDALEDELTRLLWEIGVSENDEINAQGHYIENLIDLIRNQYDE